MSMSTPSPRRPRGPRRQSGISLVFSMMALVALSLASVALIRAVNTGSGILGNLGFKQDTLMGADDATRVAIDWLSGKVASSVSDLYADITASGYYAADRPSLNATASSSSTATAMIDWTGKGCGALTGANCLLPTTVDSSKMKNAGVTAQYVVLRLCSQAGDPTTSGSTVQCATPLTASSSTSVEKNSPKSSSPRRAGSTAQSQFYRIVVRAKGARGTLSYTDTVVHF
jgi:Tfp pilus assembly protein PilX